MVVHHDHDVAARAAVPDLVLGRVGHVEVGVERLAPLAVLPHREGRHAVLSVRVGAVLPPGVGGPAEGEAVPLGVGKVDVDLEAPAAEEGGRALFQGSNFAG